MKFGPGRWLPFFVLYSALCAQSSSFAISPRVAEEAEVLEQNAAKILTQECLQQRSIMPPPRFKPRLGTALDLSTAARFRIREVQSEFSFGALRTSDTHDLIEFRQVLSVDGRPQQTVDNAVLALAQGIKLGDDRTRKRMLEEFGRNGLVDIATDYALILLTFTSRGQKQLAIAPSGEGYVGTERAMSLHWQQRSAADGVLEVHGVKTVHRALQGTLWIRAADGLPLRVSAWMEYLDDAKLLIRDDATVDYQMSQHGFLTPASVFHRHLVDGVVVTENLYSYEPFRLFSTSSSIKFGDVPEISPPTPIKK